MSRPKDADPKETRQRILESACDLLATSEVFSLRAVARKADVSIGTLQYHFADKLELTDACIDTVYDTFKNLAPTLGARLATATSQRDLIAEAVRFGFEYSRAHQPFIRILEIAVIKNGGLDLTRHHTTQLPFLSAATQLLGGDSTVPTHEMQLRLNSVVVLIGRYAILSDEALAAMFEQQPGRSLLESVEEHLVNLAVTLLAPA